MQTETSQYLSFKAIVISRVADYYDIKCAENTRYTSVKRAIVSRYYVKYDKSH